MDPKKQINMLWTNFYWLLFFMPVLIVGCSDNTSGSNTQKPTPPVVDSTGSMPEVVNSDITIIKHGTKISQLVGDYDRQLQQPTINLTFSQYKLINTDLGVPFTYGNRTYLLFGDSHGGGIEGDRDAIAYTTDTSPDDGLKLNFIHRDDNIWKPISIPRINQGAFEVPTEGVEVDGAMYIYHTTDHSQQITMGRSVVARSSDRGKTFNMLYNFSTQHFINISIVKTKASDWALFPKKKDGLAIFGSGTYRSSNVYLAWQQTDKIKNPSPGSIQYFSGIDDNGIPLWSDKENNAVALFDQPCVGEFSVSYNTFIDRWIMLYNCGNPRGINMRTAKFPWGPWSKPQVIFEPWDDGGYCHFMHTSWNSQKCDKVQDPGRENVWGGEYGPYQFENFAIGSDGKTTIYFTMSTWNPYTVVLMKSKLKKKKLRLNN